MLTTDKDVRRMQNLSHNTISTPAGSHISGTGHTSPEAWLTRVIVTPSISAAVGGAQLLRRLCASYGGIDWGGDDVTMVSQA